MYKRITIATLTILILSAIFLHWLITQLLAIGLGK